VLAVEVRSKSDYGPKAERAMAAKRAEYFAARTQVVWDVDLLGADVVRIQRRLARASPRAHDVDREERGLAGARDHVAAAREVKSRGGGGLGDAAELGRSGAGDEAAAGREPAGGGEAVGLDAAAQLQVPP